MSEFDAERSELFLSDVGVLDEERTRKLALPYMFRALGRDSDRCRISVFECGGKAAVPGAGRSLPLSAWPPPSSTTAMHSRSASPSPPSAS